MTDISRAFPGWETVRRIGCSCSGVVYEIKKDVSGYTEKAAVRVISVPENQCEIERYKDDGMSEESIKSMLEDKLNVIMDNYSVMAEFKGVSNIVYCDDIVTIPKEDGIGWDIYIKMELLTSLSAISGECTDEKIVVKIGKDICKALELYEKKNQLYRKINPHNILRSDTGEYKLGDLIAQTKTDDSFNYMAPEIRNGESFNHQSDIYSLGLLLYWLINNRRLPFLSNMCGVLPTAEENNNALAKRFNGERIPEPTKGSESLKTIILKACEFDKADRYHSATEMYRELESLEHLIDKNNLNEDYEKTIGKYHSTKERPTAQYVNNKKKWWIIVFIFLICAVFVGILFLNNFNSGDNEIEKNSADVSEPSMTKPLSQFEEIETSYSQPETHQSLDIDKIRELFVDAGEVFNKWFFTPTVSGSDTIENGVSSSRKYNAVEEDVYSISQLRDELKKYFGDDVCDYIIENCYIESNGKLYFSVVPMGFTNTLSITADKLEEDEFGWTYKVYYDIFEYEELIDSKVYETRISLINGNYVFEKFDLNAMRLCGSIKNIDTNSDSLAEFVENQEDDIKVAYRDLVNSLYNPGDQLSDYVIFDMDGDGTTELIYHKGVDRISQKFYIYTYIDGDAVKIGEMFGDLLYKTESSDGVYTYFAQMGHEILYEGTKIGNKMQVKTIFDRDAEAYSKPNEKYMLKTFAYNDYTGIENYTKS